MTYVEYGYACEDCVCAIANGDFGGMDDARASEIRTALDAIAEPLQVGEEQGFMHYACDVCGTPAGNRHAIGYLAEFAEYEPTEYGQNDNFYEDESK